MRKHLKGPVHVVLRNVHIERIAGVHAESKWRRLNVSAVDRDTQLGDTRSGALHYCLQGLELARWVDSRVAHAAVASRAACNPVEDGQQHSFSTGNLKGPSDVSRKAKALLESKRASKEPNRAV